MEQTPSAPGRSPELPSVSPPPTGETVGTFSTPEAAPGGLVERQERQGERPAAAEQAVAPPVVLPTIPTPPPTDDSVTPITQAASTVPSVANDDDLIEKEWVDKAKKVIAETKDDPYRREQEVGRLQAEYLAKRYGRELGSLQ